MIILSACLNLLVRPTVADILPTYWLDCLDNLIFFLFILWFNPMQLGMRSTFILPTNLWLLDAECDPAQEA